MSILKHLSSQAGDRAEASNKRVAARALKQPSLLAEIAIGLASTDTKLAGDCAEVMTFVAADKPELVAPYADPLIAQLDHKDTRVRWEVMHSLAEIAAQVPAKISPLVPRLVDKIDCDKSVIVRDYALLALGEYGGTSVEAARYVWPHLRKALEAQAGKHVGKALEAMQKSAAIDPGLKTEVAIIAQRFLEDKRAKVRTLAKRLQKGAAAVVEQ